MRFTSMEVSAAGLRLPGIVGDHMVLQAGKPAAIWGWADPGQVVTATLEQDVQVATADARGRWLLHFQPREPGGPYEVTIAANTTLTLRDVHVGQVWMNAGQSNMAWTVALSLNASHEITNAHDGLIRFFVTPRGVSDKPNAELRGQWRVCSPETIGDCSAVAYFFGRELRQQLEQPVGLIVSAWGGTAIETWMSMSSLKESPSFAALREQTDGKARSTTDARRLPAAPATRFNTMIHPLTPMTIAGFTWYQGEANLKSAEHYQELLTTMISDWRTRFGDPALPFLIVQLAGYGPMAQELGLSQWAELREAQAMVAQRLPRTALAVAIDIGDINSAHPLNKQEVGRRLALQALTLAYNHDLQADGPTWLDMTIDGDQARLRFKHMEGPLTTPPGEPVRGFAIAGKDQQFFWAQAKIDGQDVVVWSPHVPQPVAVRYGWADHPACNLLGPTGLPAIPFRTDTWLTSPDGQR